jgi:S1-C subfamily serine protease
VTEHHRPDATGHGADDRTAPQPTGWPWAPPRTQPSAQAPAAPGPAAQAPATAGRFPADGATGAQIPPGQFPPAGQPHGYGHPTGPLFGPPTPPAGALPYAAPAGTPHQRRGGRARLGVATLLAGALIGGGAGAGVAVLLDEDPVVAASSASGQPVVIQDPETATTATAAAAKAAPSVVTIYVSSASGSGSGSGVILTEDGYVLTNNHVVADAGEGGSVQVRTADGTLYDAEVVGTEPSADIGVVKLADASGLTAATFANSEDVQVGDVAVAIGAPLGLSNTVTDGIISATNRAVALGQSQNDTTVIDAIQTDAAINPGNSGGALVDAAGEVVGINTAIASVASGMPGGADQSGNIGVGFAVPSNTAKRIATEIIENGAAEQTLLGVSATTEADSGSAIGAGARVVSVQGGSPAGEAGLQAGDVVTAIDDRPITTSTELTAAVRSNSPGDEVTLTVRRGGDSQTVEVTLGSTG